MVSEPRISVVVLCYNFEPYIGECIESILSQTLQPYEIVICDDHSLDGSWPIITHYARKHPDLVRAIRHEQNIGQVHNGNFARTVTKGDLVSFMDGDDRWLPQKLEMEWRALRKHPDAAIAYSGVFIIDADGNRTWAWQMHCPISSDLIHQMPATDTVVAFSVRNTTTKS